jgi:flagellar biogenesis protein FliO
VGGPIVTEDVLCLTINLLLTGVFIWFVKKLLRGVPAEAAARAP